MKNIEIRTPNIQHILDITQKYIHLMDERKNEFDEIASHWQDLTVKTLEITQKSKVKLFTKEQLPQYLEDNFRAFNVSLYSAWALGREYAETSPEQAKYYLLLEDPNSEYILESTRNELNDLADYAMILLLHNINALHQAKIFDDASTLVSIETAKQMFKKGIFWSFQNGIMSIHKK